MMYMGKNLKHYIVNKDCDMAILYGFIFQALLLMNQIAVLVYSISNNRWRPSVGAPAFSVGYAGYLGEYGHTIGIDSTVR